MNEIEIKRRATVHDVARAAGVSLATVDRVLNGRAGVRPATAEKVDQAIAALGFQRDVSASLLARSRDLNIVFFIPDGTNEFMASLAQAVTRRAAFARAERMQIGYRHFRALDAEALASALDGLDARSADCAIIVASEDEPVLAAVERLNRRGILVVTLVSDLPGSARRHFVGIDNVAAGRTAGSLIGRFCAPNSTVGVVVGSMHLRDHRERLEGFRAVIERDFGALVLLDPVEGDDLAAQTESRTRALLAAHPQISALYNLGAGNSGLVSALEASGRAGTVRVIAHEVTEPTRRGLISGAIDVVLDQNPDGEIRAAIDAARVLALGTGTVLAPETIEIGIFLRDNLG